MADQRIHWISTSGGRFIVLPDSSLSTWRGCPRDGREPSDTSHDYGRACATSDYVDILTVGETHTLVFGENELGGVWLQSPHPILLEWIYAESKDAVADFLAQLPADVPASASIRFAVTSDHLNVFDSAFPGDEYDPQHSCRFPIQSGTYNIESCIYEPDDETSLIIHRFLPA